MWNVVKLVQVTVLHNNKEMPTDSKLAKGGVVRTF